MRKNNLNKPDFQQVVLQAGYSPVFPLDLVGDYPEGYFIDEHRKTMKFLEGDYVHVPIIHLGATGVTREYVLNALANLKHHYKSLLLLEAAKEPQRKPFKRERLYTLEIKCRKVLWNWQPRVCVEVYRGEDIVFDGPVRDEYYGWCEVGFVILDSDCVTLA